MNTKNENEQLTADFLIENTNEHIDKDIKPKKKVSKSKATVKEDKKPTEKKKVTKATKNDASKSSEKEKSSVKKTTTKKPAAKKTTKKVEVKKEKDETNTLKEEVIKEEATKKIAPKKTSTKTKASRNVTKEKIKEKEEAVIQNEDLVKTSIETTASQLHVEDIKRNKLFFVSDMDEEAVYLHDMSLQGYHFVTKKGMQYTFRQGDPKNYYYHLGYYEKSIRDGERYLDNYIEAGWENIFHEKAEFDGIWNYFRIEMPVNAEEPNIFSDRVSRLALYKRLLSGWRSLLAVDVICFLFLIFVYFFLSSHPSNLTGLFMTLCIILGIVILLIFIIYLRAYRKISRKQEELQNI